MTTYPTRYVLDSFAVLAFLEGESGANLVQGVLENAKRGDVEGFLSVISLGEVLYIVEREQGLAQARRTVAVIEDLPLHILPATQERVFAAAHVKANYRVSYADAFVVAAAEELRATVLTGDPEFKAVESIIKVEWLPQR